MPENREPVDHNLAWRQWTGFLQRQQWWMAVPVKFATRALPEFRREVLKMPAAREWQRRPRRRFQPETRIDPRNPYRPIIEWPGDALDDDAPLTQFHQRYEYPFIPVSPWAIYHGGMPTPTGQYWRPPNKKTWVERGYEHPHDPHPKFFGLTYCILLEDIPDLGELHDVVAVHPEQFRQELHPSRLAVVATRENCTLLNVHWDPLYQDYPRREMQGKLMDRQPWVWDQLQGLPWDEWTAPTQEEMRSLKSGDYVVADDTPKMSREELIAESKAKAAAKKAEQDAEKARLASYLDDPEGETYRVQETFDSDSDF